ncbi:MAG: hypothetical protein ACOCSD_01790 [Halolamina sp.]
MASTIYLVSAALMALLLVVVVAAVVGRNWKGYTPTLRNDRSTLSALAGSETAWAVAFVVGALAIGIGTTWFVGGEELPASIVSTGGVVVGIGLALSFLFYLFYGTYAAAKARGYQRAAAVMAGSWVLGLLIVAVITLNLLTA